MRVAGRLMKKVRPKPVVVVGFGGYPTVPPLLAASRAGVPTMIHEQNAVMGRANKALGQPCQGDCRWLPAGEPMDPMRQRR
jgi:UDP-N-acetylglucosamine--N-acetylmuramyl-(pentapeptide) pyrophosphoryl-undecaprenol N-acetylglucosamine transferase